MSDINANIVISPIDLGVTVNTNQLSFTPEAISLNIYAGGVGTSNALSANIANVHIYGGVNGYVLQTDGTGNLTWTAQTGNGGGGNGTPGGSNTQVQYNDSGSFGGNAGFTFDEVTGFLNVPGNVTAPYFVGNATFATFAAGATTVTASSQPNITSVGNLTTLTVIGDTNTSNIFTAGLSGNITGANVIFANTFSGNLSNAVTVNATSVISNTVNATSVTSNNITSTYIITTPTIYASLPIASSVGGARAMINNANTRVFGNLVNGGGSNIMPVYSDGSFWRVG